jgi:hypothetical protein
MQESTGERSWVIIHISGPVPEEWPGMRQRRSGVSYVGHPAQDLIGLSQLAANKAPILATEAVTVTLAPVKKTRRLPGIWRCTKQRRGTLGEVRAAPGGSAGHLG